MSTPNLFNRNTPAQSVPRGDVLQSVDTYPEAQSIVNRLTHAGYPVADIAIVGRDLVTVERVLGRMTYARVALKGALNGAWFGLFIGFLMGVTATGAETVYVPATMAIGAGIGMLFNLVIYSLRRKRQDFSSVQQVIASVYDIIVPNGTADAARTALTSAAKD
ncbi:MAG: general stress protein [Microbacteriaceae bacterium]